MDQNTRGVRTIIVLRKNNGTPWSESERVLLKKAGANIAIQGGKPHVLCVLNEVTKGAFSSILGHANFSEGSAPYDLLYPE